MQDQEVEYQISLNADEMHVILLILTKQLNLLCGADDEDGDLLSPALSIADKIVAVTAGAIKKAAH